MKATEESSPATYLPRRPWINYQAFKARSSTMVNVFGSRREEKGKQTLRLRIPSEDGLSAAIYTHKDHAGKIGSKPILRCY
jgi:hypothetical protein